MTLSALLLVIVIKVLMLRTGLGFMQSTLPSKRCGACRHLGRKPRSSLKMAKGFFGASAASEKDPGTVKGTSLKILKYPHPQLRAENGHITTFGEDVEQIAKEMLLVMYAADGIGLAAPQVGINKRLMVFNEKGDPKDSDYEMVLCNPTIMATAGEEDTKEEGCLSFPQIYGRVTRAKWIEVEFNTLEGDKVQRTFEGMPARIFQHEYDHLDKTLFIDRLIEEDKGVNQKRLDKLIKKYGPGGAV